MTVRVLLAGQVDGNFEALIKRANTVIKKTGAFAALFCVGRFFQKGDASAPCPDFIQACIDGTQELPLPVYFIAREGTGSDEALARLSEAAPACQLRYLGEHGVRAIAGLRVAFFDDLSCHNRAPFISDLNSSDGDIDLLLTCAWPAGIMASTTAPEGCPDGSQDVREIAIAARPRYHVASAPQLFHQRDPYMNRDLGAGAHATRFISLAGIGNTTKSKWLHALGLAPAAGMKPAELCAKPEGCTASPYLVPYTKKRAAGDQPWRWGAEGPSQRRKDASGNPLPVVPTDAARSVYVKNLPYSATEEDLVAFFSKAGVVADVRWGKGVDGKRHGWAHVQFEAEASVGAAREMSGQALLGRDLFIDAATGEQKASLNLGKPVEDCWFCLSNAQADVHLVADVLDEAYLALDKGPISDTHALVVAVEHYPNAVTLQPSALADFDRLVAALRRAYASRKLQLVGFERYLAFHSRGGNHCHINFIGISESAAASAQATLCSAAESYGFTFTHVPAAEGEDGRKALKDLVADGQYFQAFLPDGSRLIHPISRQERHPMHFGREVLAKLAGVPQRSDWRNCKAASAAEEEEKTAQFQSFFSAFSPNSQQES